MSCPPLQSPDTLHLQAAQGWLELGNYVEADAELDGITASLRAHPDVLKVCWEIYAAAKKWEAALDIAAALVRLIPEEAVGWETRPFCVHEMKRTTEARDNLLPVVEKFPDDAIKPFARRLHDALQAQGIRCWLDEKQLLPGDHIHREIDEAVRLWDKVRLCCSEKSLTSWWVDMEVSKALKKEEELWKERCKQVLAIIPLNMDGYMFRPDWQDWKKQHLTDRLAADFTGWETDNAKFEEQLARVVKVLRADARARQPPPKPKL
jgi:predicted metal-dependent peptidase